jgi:hypothetical protein
MFDLYLGFRLGLSLMSGVELSKRLVPPSSASAQSTKIYKEV